MKRSQIVVEFVALLSIVVIIGISVLLVVYEQPENMFARGGSDWTGLPLEVQGFVSNGTAVGVRVLNNDIHDAVITGLYIDDVWAGNNTYIIDAGEVGQIVYNYSGDIQNVVLVVSVVDESQIVNISTGGRQDATSVTGGLAGVSPNLYVGLIGYYHFDAADTALQTDSSGYGQHADTVFDDTFIAPGRVGNSAYFDRDGDYIDVGTTISSTYIDADTGEVTVSLWVEPRSGGNSMVWWEGETQLLYYPGVQQYLFRLRNTTSQVSTYIYADAAVNTWSHVAQRRNATHVALYVDGLFVNATAHSGGTFLGLDLYLGKDEGTNYMNGSIDEFMVWNRSLSDDEIQELYLLQAFS